MPISPEAAFAVEISLFPIILAQISLCSGSPCCSLTPSVEQTQQGETLTQAHSSPLLPFLPSEALSIRVS